MKTWIRKQAAKHQEPLGAVCLLGSQAILLMLIPFGWEMLAAIAAQLLFFTGVSILDAHVQAILVATRMERDR